jgi:hypothetical protein
MPEVVVEESHSKAESNQEECDIVRSADTPRRFNLKNRELFFAVLSRGAANQSEKDNRTSQGDGDGKQLAIGEGGVLTFLRGLSHRSP